MPRKPHPVIIGSADTLTADVIEAAEQMVEALESPWGSDRMEDIENAGHALVAAVRARRKGQQ
jgi:hypothetical protein